METKNETAQRLANSKQKQINELEVLKIIVTKRIEKLTDEQDIAKNKAIINQIGQSLIKCQEELDEFLDVANTI